MRYLPIALALGGLLAADPAPAQQHQHAPQPAEPAGMMEMHGAGVMPGMPAMPGMRAMHVMQGMMMPGPGMILRLREPLGLSDAQVQRLTTLQEREQQADHPHVMAAMQAMRDAHRMLEQSDPDLTGYEAKLKEAAQQMVQAHMAMARTSVEAREVLTPQQRMKLMTGVEMMRYMMPMEARAMRRRMAPAAPPAQR